MKTYQETFDTVAAHLIRQGRQARLSNGHCAYRGNGGLKCAAGCLIPDDKYHSSFEGSRCTQYKIERVLLDEGHDPEFVVKLQRLHDNEVNWQDIKSALRRFAVMFRLSPDVVDYTEVAP